MEYILNTDQTVVDYKNSDLNLKKGKYPKPKSPTPTLLSLSPSKGRFYWFTDLNKIQHYDLVHDEQGDYSLDLREYYTEIWRSFDQVYLNRHFETFDKLKAFVEKTFLKDKKNVYYAELLTKVLPRKLRNEMLDLLNEQEFVSLSISKRAIPLIKKNIILENIQILFDGIEKKSLSNVFFVLKKTFDLHPKYGIFPLEDGIIKDISYVLQNQLLIPSYYSLNGKKRKYPIEKQQKYYDELKDFSREIYMEIKPQLKSIRFQSKKHNRYIASSIIFLVELKLSKQRQKAGLRSLPKKSYCELSNLSLSILNKYIKAIKELLKNQKESSSY